MYLEAMHKNLKYIYLEGRKNRRMDKCIKALMKLTRDIMFKKIKKNIKRNDSYRMKCIQASHIKSLSISDITEVDSNSWKVKSLSSDNCYTVDKLTEICTDEVCPLSCRQCKICIHNFSCSCPDFQIKYNICKHIHAVTSKLAVSSRAILSTNETHTQELVHFVVDHNDQHDLQRSNNR